MAQNQGRIQRFLPTSFTMKDVAVILTAAVTAASPFFAFDAKIEALQDKYQLVQSENAALSDKSDKLIEQVITVTTRLQYLEGERQIGDADRARLNLKVIELEARMYRPR